MRIKVFGAGPPMFYLPGLDGTGELLFQQIPALSRYFTVITCAYRDQPKLTYQDLIDDIVKVMDQRQLPNALICGESFGGTLALSFALAQPSRVTRLAIINSFPYFRNRALLTLGHYVLDFTPFEVILYGRRIGTKFRLLAEDLPPAELANFLKITEQVPKMAVVRRMQLIEKFDVRNRLSEITVPTLFIASEFDRLQNSLLEAREMAAQLPDAQVHIIPGMGHVPLPSPACSLGDIFARYNWLPPLDLSNQ